MWGRLRHQGFPVPPVSRHADVTARWHARIPPETLYRPQSRRSVYRRLQRIRNLQKAWPAVHGQSW